MSKSFTESVIREVKKRPCLWDIHNEMYKYKIEKQKAWQEICAAVSRDYVAASSYAERKEIERSVQLRWKTARDAYMKCRANQYKNKSNSKYVFYDLLRFLGQAKNGQAETANNSVPETSSKDNDVTEGTDPQSKTRCKIWRRKIKNRAPSDFESQFLKIMRAGVNSSLATHSTALKEDDQNFFNSLAPIINDFDNYKKLVFRSRILELAMDVGSVQSNSENVPVPAPASEETYFIKLEDHD